MRKISAQTGLWSRQVMLAALAVLAALAGPTALAGEAAGPAAAVASDDTSLTQVGLEPQANRLLRGWVAEAAAGEAALPAGAVLDRVDVVQGVAAAYVQLPGEFLTHLTADECEAIVRQQVDLLKGIEGLSGFAILARPAGDAAGDYRPLPAYLPQPTGETDKPEDYSDEGLRGGLPTYNPGRPGGALSGKTVFLNPGHGWYYSSTLSRWATQRGNSYGIIEDLSNGEAVLLHLARYLHNAGANVWTCRERDLNTNMVIVDNTDGAPNFSVTGSWTTSTSSGTWYGTNYQHHAVSTTETAVASYTPSFPQAGYYSVYIWTPAASNRATDAKVRVKHTGGTTTHVINMQQDGNTWRFLGVYYFGAGRDATKGAVEISDQGSNTSQYVIADAVRFGGGMGSYVEASGVSGQPRWEESGRYYPVFMGQPSTPYGTVDAMPRYTKWENESWEDSIYVSWHTNASTGAGHGTDVYVYGPNGPPSPFSEFSGVAGSDSLATRIRDEIINDLRLAWNDASWPGRLYTAWFGELNPTYNDETPGVLIEVAYHDSATDAESILDPRFRDMFSRAVYQSIVKWWRYDADGPSSTPIATATLLPEPPTHVLVRNQGSGVVRVSWRAPAYNTGNNLLGDAATGYLVQTSTDGYGFSNGTATSNTYLDVSGLTTGAVYYFRVVATNAGGQSFPSEIGGAMVTSGAPAVLVVNGFDRLDKESMLAEDDPYSTNAMIRERPDRMNHYGYIRTYADALAALNMPFDSAANEAVRDADVTLSSYGATVWDSGEESTVDDTFDSTEQTKVSLYLFGGGKLFVSGSNLGYDLDDQNNGRSFYNNMLRADFVADDAGTYMATPAAGSIFDGIGSLTFDNGSMVYDVNAPDVMTPLNGSTTAMTYVGGTGGTAAVVYSGTAKVVHLGFPYPALINRYNRLDVMYAALNFFGLNPDEPPPSPPADIILECRDAAGTLTPAPAYVEAGAWANSTVKSTAPGLTGTGSRFITYDIPNAGTDNATFVPNVSVAGKYEVFVTWGNGANCYDAKYTVMHHSGQAVQLIDQIASGAPEAGNYNQWISLGQYWFPAGQSSSTCAVNVSEETVTGKPSASYNQRVYTDGLKLVFVDWWPNGDANDDGRVDLTDFATLPGCLLGPGGGYANASCEVFDFDLDGDVDLGDFAAFQMAFRAGD